MKNTVALILGLLFLQACQEPEITFTDTPSLRPVKTKDISLKKTNFHSRRTIVSRLIFIFGDTHKELFNDLVSIPTFGEPCNLYSKNKFLGPGECQKNRNNTSIPFNDYSTSAKYGSLAQICYKATENPLSLNYAINRVQNLNPQNEKQAVEKAARMFYTNHSPTQEALSSLENVKRTAEKKFQGDKVQGWRYLLLTLCLSSGWQIR